MDLKLVYKLEGDGEKVTSRTKTFTKVNPNANDDGFKGFASAFTSLSKIGEYQIFKVQTEQIL